MVSENLSLGIEHGTNWVINIPFSLNLFFIECRPHPIGSWGIYLPLEQFTEAASFISMYHGNLTILLHPNSGHPKIDHLLNAFWIKSFLPLDGKNLVHWNIDLSVRSCRRSIE